MAIKTEDGIESFSLALNGSGLVSYSNQWVWFPTFCQIPGRGLQLFASNYIVDGDGGASSSQRGRRDYFTTRNYHRDFKDLGLDRLSGFSGEVSDSDVEKFSKLARFAGKTPEFIRNVIKDLRELSPSRSSLENLLKIYKAEVTEANLKTLEKILRNQYQSCRTVRLISNLRNRGIVSNMIGDVAMVGDAAIGALGTAL